MIYVWLDALCNYATAVGFGSDDPADQQKLERYWPADVHMIGKEIVRFHCVYWPAFLLAAGLPLPQSIVAHGWLLFEESKMSKSRGNIVRSETILDMLGADALRYFLFREIVFGQDGSFSFDALVQRFNTDLANGLGNLASRTLSMIPRYFEGEIPYPSHGERTPAEDAIADLAQQTIADFKRCSSTSSSRAPWKRSGPCSPPSTNTSSRTSPGRSRRSDDKDSRARLATILYTSAEALRIITALVHPVIPDSTARIWAQLGLGDIGKLDLRSLAWGQLQLGTKLGKIEAVFPRADKSTIERMQQMEQQRSAEGASKEATADSRRRTASRRQPAARPADSAPPSVRRRPAPAAGSRQQHHHRRLPQGRAARRRGQGRRKSEGRRQTPAPGSRYRHRSPPDRRRHRQGLRAGEADRTQGRHRRQPAAAQTARPGIARHDRRRLARRRRPAGAGRIPGRGPERREAEVSRWPLFALRR